MPSFISGANITDLCSKLAENTVIDPNLYEKYHVKRGLRNSDGTGVMAGITNICNVHGYVMNEGEREPIPGQLIYRGYNVNDLVENVEKDDRFGYEETAFRPFPCAFLSVLLFSAPKEPVHAACRFPGRISPR